MLGVRWKRTGIPIVMAAAVGLMAACSSTPTYGTSGAQFRIAFPSAPVEAVVTKSELVTFQGSSMVSGTIFTVGVSANQMFSQNAAPPKSDAFAVLIGHFASSSAASKFVAVYKSSSGMKSVMVGARPGYEMVASATSSGASGSKATPGELVLADGNNAFVIVSVTKSKSTTSSFLGSLDVLS